MAISDLVYKRFMCMTLQIIFDFPNEVLTHITGYYGPAMYMGPGMYMGPDVIKSLTFHTNKRIYGPYGEDQGTHFTTKLKEGKVLGIHGRKGLFLDAIGVHVLEGKVITPVSNASPPCKAVVSKEPSIAEIDSAQWPAKLVLAKQAPREEVYISLSSEDLKYKHTNS